MTGDAKNGPTNACEIRTADGWRVVGIDALLTTLAGNPGAGAAAAYRSALTRHGKQLHATSGPEALTAVIKRIRADAADKA